MSTDGDPFLRLERQLGAAARRAEQASTIPKTRRPRPSKVTIGVAICLLGASSGAGAFVIERSTTNDLGRAARPATPTAAGLAPLLGALDASDAALTKHGSSNGGPVRNLTVRRSGLSIDVALSDRRLCLGTRDTPQPRLACHGLPLSARDPLYLRAGVGLRTFLVAVVPDGFVRMSVTDSRGLVRSGKIKDNIAIVPLTDQRLASIHARSASGELLELASPRLSQDDATPKVRRLRPHSPPDSASNRP